MANRLLVVIFIFFAGCQWPWEIYTDNPNLKLVIRKDNYTFLNPIWHPDGERIFYLGREYPSDDEYKLKVVNIDGSDNKLILDGNFGHLSMARDGSKLALVTGKMFFDSYYEDEETHRYLILTDVNGDIIDTIPTSQSKVLCAEFSWNDSFLYYGCEEEGNTRSFYKINLFTYEEEFVSPWIKSNPSNGFCLSHSDSIIIYGLTPQTHPTEAKYIIIGGGDLILCNLNDGVDSHLDASPYKDSQVAFPHWSPNGRDVIFSAAKCFGDPVRPRNYEIWILEEIFE